MQVLIYGTGAIGSYIGGQLLQNGVDVTFVARGANYEALAQKGLTMSWDDARQVHQKVVVKRPGEFKKRFDVIYVTLKAMQLVDAAQDIQSLLANDGALVMIQNGLPWWYFQNIASPWQGQTLQSLDPDKSLAKQINLAQVIGATIYRPITMKVPGHVTINRYASEKLIIGEVDNQLTNRLEKIQTLTHLSGIPTQATSDIRGAKWNKLMLNLVWNPLCALTRRAPGHIAAFPGGTQLIKELFNEGKAVAASLGVTVSLDEQNELKRVQSIFNEKPSMFHDAVNGRPMEIDAIVNAVIECAQITQTPTPNLNTLATYIGLLNQHLQEKNDDLIQ
jgi:2-dehydropantoate 2-reductase